MTIALLGLNVEVKNCGQDVVLTDGRNSTFYFFVISCALARRVLRRGLAEASDSGGIQRSACGRGDAVMRSV